MDFLELAKQRYSCRKFSDRTVEKEKIDLMIEAGLTSPTAVNKQPYRIWVMERPALTEKLEQVTKWTFGAKQFLMVGCKKEEAWVRKTDEKNFGEVDAAIVATHIMLEAEQLGIGTTWVAGMDEALLKTLIPELADYTIVALFPLGYPAEDAKPAGMHFKNRDRSELVQTL